MRKTQSVTIGRSVGLSRASSGTARARGLAVHPLAKINRAVRLRVQAVQSVDRMLTTVQQTLQRLHRLRRNTYAVFSSDKGLHAGEYRMMPGKLTAFDGDIHVPLVVAGPGIWAGSSTDAMAENVYLADTFADMGATSRSTDVYSLLPLLHGAARSGWRDAALIEHHHPCPRFTTPIGRARSEVIRHPTRRSAPRPSSTWSTWTATASSTTCGLSL